jgi:glycosyltransferase involved in cell wall biosynthesis
VIVSLPSDRRKKKIYYWGADWFGTAWYRCHVPGVELKKRGYEVVLDDKLSRRAVREFDVIVFQKKWEPGALEAIQDANRLGKLTVYEIDDDVWHIDPANPSYPFWTPEKLRIVQLCIKECQVVTASTDYLAKVVQKFNPNVFVLPNMLPEEFWRFGPRKPRRGKIVVGWAGSVSHWSDLCILKGTVEQILDAYPNLYFEVVGMKTYPFRKHERMRVLEPKKVEGYPELLRRFDIGLAPIIDNEFNRCKSDLKFIEYGMAEVAFIGSKVEPYIRSVKHGETGYLVRNPKDWLKYIRRLIENPSLREKLVKKAKEFAQKRTIARNIHLWEKVYRLR